MYLLHYLNSYDRTYSHKPQVRIALFLGICWEHLGSTLRPEGSWFAGFSLPAPQLHFRDTSKM